jgi:TRAP-type uncharacterized transport system substrate-binding protein
MKRIITNLAFGLLLMALFIPVGYSQQKAIKRYSIATGGTQGIFYLLVQEFLKSYINIYQKLKS